MHYEELLGHVQRRADLEKQEADRLTRATLRTLAERIGEDEADQLAAELPHEFHDELLQGSGERFSVDEFVNRIRETTDGDVDETRKQIRAVFSVLLEAASVGEIDDIRARLPDTFDQFFEPEEE